MHCTTVKLSSFSTKFISRFLPTVRHIRNNHNLKNHVFAAAAFTCFVLTLSLCFSSIKHKSSDRKISLWWRQREQEGGKVCPIGFDTTSWITFLCGFEWCYERLTWRHCFKGESFYLVFTECCAHPLEPTVKRKTQIWHRLMGFCYYFFLHSRESFDVKDLYGILKNLLKKFLSRDIFLKVRNVRKILGEKIEKIIYLEDEFEEGFMKI